MYYNKVDISGVDTSSLTVLKEAEKMQLLRDFRGGDRSAREKLIKGNLRLVLSVLQKFTGRGENPDDLFQVGVIGLIKAIDNFNTDLDVKFSTYAVPMISGELRRYLRDNTPIRVSRSLRDLAYKAMQAKEGLRPRRRWSRLLKAFPTPCPFMSRSTQTAVTHSISSISWETAATVTAG